LTWFKFTNLKFTLDGQDQVISGLLCFLLPSLFMIFLSNWITTEE